MSIIEREQLDDTLTEIRELPETAEPRTREQILLDAATAIETYGWNSGSDATQHPSAGYGLCILGAVGYALDPNGPRISGCAGSGEPLMRTAWMSAPRFLGLHDSGSAWGWNDGLRHNRVTERRFKVGPRREVVTPGERVAKCLRLMAGGMTFAEASAQS